MLTGTLPRVRTHSWLYAPLVRAAFGMTLLRAGRPPLRRGGRPRATSCPVSGSGGCENREDDDESEDEDDDDDAVSGGMLPFFAGALCVAAKPTKNERTAHVPKLEVLEPSVGTVARNIH